MTPEPDRHLAHATRTLLKLIEQKLGDNELNRNQVLDNIGQTIYEFLGQWDKHRAMQITLLERQVVDLVMLQPPPPMMLYPQPKPGESIVVQYPGEPARIVPALTFCTHCEDFVAPGQPCRRTDEKGDRPSACNLP